VSESLSPAAYAVALASLPAMGPRRLLRLLREHPPEEAWAREAPAADAERAWHACVAAGIEVVVLGDARYPRRLVDDPDPPAVLFTRGRLGCLDPPTVAIVGTRRCSRYGRDVAHELGADLAAAGVAVVSGLALGIDGAAHEGALDGGGVPPAGAVGSGLDVVYPRRHRSLWQRVADAGVLVGEAPPGAAPEPWRFPARNRIIAALADVVVVVESHAAGGSRHTVDAAEQRDRPILAVPGPVRSSSSAGTNELLAQGAAPARDAGDVLVALSLVGAIVRDPSRRDLDRRPPPTGAAATLLDAIGWQPATMADLVARTGLSPMSASLAVAHLQRDGWLTSRGDWLEQVVPGGRSAER